MFLKDFKSGWRNIVKNKLFSSINILGLSIGLAVTTLILFWVVDELDYDKFHSNIDQIYTVYEHQQYSDGQELFTPCTPFPLSRMLATDFDEVEHATTFTQMGNMPFSYEDKKFNKGPVMVADEHFFNIYSFEVLSGDINCLSQADKIAITPEIATLYYGTDDPIGKTLVLSNQYPLEVGAIVKRPDKNSSLDFKVVLPLMFMHKNEWTDIKSWGGNWPRTSILLSANTNETEFAEKIQNICKNHGQENTSLHLFPLSKEHLYNYSGEKNRVQYIYQFLAISFIIILIACINFVNFSTARSEQRKPEIGIRKSLGASRINLIRQFFNEKGLTVVFSVFVAFILVFLLLPLFNQYVNKTIDLSILKNKYLLWMILIVVFTTVMLSIVYPALYMSSFAPARVLKKQGKVKSSIGGFKNGLIIVQFALSIGLIICSIFISAQLKYLSNYDLGYNKENLVYLELNGSSSKKHEALITEFRKIGGIVNLSRTSGLPFMGGSSSWGFQWEGKDQDKEILFCHVQVDRNYFETMGIELLDGKTYSKIYDKIDPERPTLEVVMNQEAIRLMGIEPAIGKKFWNDDNNPKATIVGVAANYNFQSLRNKIEPLIIRPLQGNPNFIIARVNSANFGSSIEQLKQTWNKVCPDTKHVLGFFDERIASLYNAEQKVAGLFKTFTLIAIFISCIGLFGLSLFAIETRRKEIGIRKVNGSTRVEIMTLINKEFVSKVIIAFIIACPVSFFIMSKWLENFAFKTTLNWWVFLLSGIIALMVAVATVSWQSWKAATRNPVEALRYE